MDLQLHTRRRWIFLADHLLDPHASSSCNARHHPLIRLETVRSAWLRLNPTRPSNQIRPAPLGGACYLPAAFHERDVVTSTGSFLESQACIVFPRFDARVYDGLFAFLCITETVDSGKPPSYYRTYQDPVQNYSR